MSTNRSDNNNRGGSSKTKGGIIGFIIVAVLFVAGFLVTGNYKTFLPFIDWGDEETSSYTQEVDYDDDEEDSSIVVESAPPEESSAPAETTTAPTTTSAPKTTTATAQTEPEDEPVEIAYSFRNQSTYDSHYEKHRAEFGDITQEEYLELANKLIFSDADTVLTKYADDGDFMYFDTATGYFLVLSPDEYIRTFFVPDDGIEYWDRQ